MPVFKWKTDFGLSVNGAAGNRLPWVSVNPNGSFDINYAHGFDSTEDDAFFQRFDAAGNAGPRQSISNVGAVTERMASSAFLGNGRQVALWTAAAYDASGSGGDIYFKILRADRTTAIFNVQVGSGIDPVMAVSTYSTGTIIAVAFINTTLTGNPITVRMFSEDGAAVNYLSPVNTTATFDNGFDTRDVAISTLSNGSFVVTWSTAAGETRGRVLTMGGGFGTEFIATTTTNGTIFIAPDVVALADGRFAVVQIGNDLTATGRIFSATGVADGPSFVIATNSHYANGNRIDAAAFTDGRFVVVWQNTMGDIEGQIMKANGTKDGDSFIVNTVTTGTQSRPSVDVLADGRFVVSWEDTSAGTSKITSTIFDPRNAGLFTSASSLFDDWYGTNYQDVVFMGQGDDSFYGGAGNDVIYGESGNDTLYGNGDDDYMDGGNGDDIMSGGDGNDTLLGQFGNDTLYGGNGVDIIEGGTGNDTINGEGGNDSWLFGGAGNDVISGGAGNDMLLGGDGNDYLDGGVDADQISGGLGDDTIFGGAGDDPYLSGDAGNDFINGGAGADVMIGGAGNDVFQFYASDFAAGVQDRIVDFSSSISNIDTLYLQGTGSDYTFTAVGSDVVVAHAPTGGTILVSNFNGATLFFDRTTYF